MRRNTGDPGAESKSPLFGLMIAVFLGGGLLASSEALLVPRFKQLLHLNFAQALSVQLLYYLGYLLVAAPAAILTARIGLMRAVSTALGVMAVGSFAVEEAQRSLGFGEILIALLLLSSGVTVLQVACNGAMASFGGRLAGVSRFTLLQAFNSLGTVAGPVAASWFLLGNGQDAISRIPFLFFALFFGALAVAFFAARHSTPDFRGAQKASAAAFRRLIRSPRMRRGTAAIFAYVGAEVTIGTLGVSYLMLPDRLDVGAVAAGQLISLYWAGAMIGRFAGAWLLLRRTAAQLLLCASLSAMGLMTGAILLPGIAGGMALLAVGLCNSIMFPTIYGIAMPDDPDDVPMASMLLCMAVVGGAVVPMATGYAADRLGLPAALCLPLGCYVGISIFARSAAADLPGKAV